MLRKGAKAGDSGRRRRSGARWPVSPPRRPRASPLWQCAKRHARDLHEAGRSRRVLLYADWVEANVLASVPHRQYVLTVPKLLWPAFGQPQAMERSPPVPSDAWPLNSVLPLTYHRVPDIA